MKLLKSEGKCPICKKEVSYKDALWHAVLTKKGMAHVECVEKKRKNARNKRSSKRTGRA